MLVLKAFVDEFTPKKILFKLAVCSVPTVGYYYFKIKEMNKKHDDELKAIDQSIELYKKGIIESRRQSSEKLKNSSSCTLEFRRRLAELDAEFEMNRQYFESD